jgi:NodT family efflux transporter outer membrane factor (OMF) lipoprotein
MAELSEPIPIDNSIDYALAREFFEEGGWPTESWWEMFDDPQLNHLIETALQESPTIQQALAKVAQAEQEARKERAALFPTLDAEYEEQWQYFSKNGFVRSFYPTVPPVIPPPTANQLDLTLNFNYEIDFFGRNRNLFKAALGLARAQRAEAKQAILILTTLIAQTYIELQTKISQKEVLEERLNQRDQLFELSFFREYYGVDAANPVLEREQSFYAVSQAMIDLEKGIALDRHLLSVLVGVSPDAKMAPKPMTVIFEKPLSLPADLSSDLLARRPDLTAQLWRVEAAAKEIGAAKADFYPRVNLMAFAGLESLAFNKLFHISSRQGGLVPAVHLPIFTGGKLTANLKSKVATFNQETYRFNDMLLHAAQEVADQITTLSATFDTLTEQISILESAEDQWNLQYARYQHGVDNFIAVLEKEDNVLSQRYQFLGLERDYLLAVLKMIKALGGGYCAEGHLPYSGEQR